MMCRTCFRENNKWGELCEYCGTIQPTEAQFKEWAAEQQRLIRDEIYRTARFRRLYAVIAALARHLAGYHSRRPWVIKLQMQAIMALGGLGHWAHG